MPTLTPTSLTYRAPSPAALSLLQSTTWGTALLSDPTQRPFYIDHREPKPHTFDSIMSTTLNTPDTIALWQGFYQPVQSSSSSTITSTPSPASNSERPYGTYTHIVRIGDNLNGHAHTLHGGALSTILDEALSQASRSHVTPGFITYTASLHVDFKARCPTPGTLVVRCWLEERSGGRKHWLKGTVGGCEEADGVWKEVVYAQGTSLCVEVPYAKVGNFDLYEDSARKAEEGKKNGTEKARL
jgi:thioesterase superfamily protein 4